MAHNDKSVTKEQNDRHRKILEGLMKLPENRECADCKSKGPQWASVNLGSFVCIQCSGIHRSLGVHISKVQSATLDTWLPEEVTFMQSMGNAKANVFWEAELPSVYRRPRENDRGGLEAFIRLKYETRRWVPKKKILPVKGHDERCVSTDGPRRSLDNGKEGKSSNPGKGDTKGSDVSEFAELRRHDFEDEQQEVSRATRSPSHAPSSASSSFETPASKESVSHFLVLPAPKASQNPLHPVQAATVPKVEALTDLFNFLNMEGPSQTGVPVSSSFSDEQGWAAFQSAKTAPAVENIDQAVPSGGESSGAGALASTVESSTKNDVMAGLEDLFKGSPAVFLSVPDAPQLKKDVKKEDILSLFGQRSVASPFVDHQQQMAALLAQRQSMLMAATAAAASGGKIPAGTPGNQHVQDLNTAAGNAASGSTWSAGASHVAGLMNNSEVQFAGLPHGQLADLDGSLVDLEDELCVEFGSCLWADVADDYHSFDEDTENYLVEAIADVLLEGSVLLQGGPCSGTSDRDAIVPGQLSPMLKLVVEGKHVSIERLDEFHGLASKSKAESPLKKINVKWNEVSSFFRSSFRIQGVTELMNWEDRSSQFIYGTGFCVSEKHISSALHLRDAEGKKVLAWRGVQVAASAEQFQDNKLPRFHFKSLDVPIDATDAEMDDPVTGRLYDLANLNRVDAAIWEIESSSVYRGFFPNPRNVTLIKRSDCFLVPMSMAMEKVYLILSEEKPACAMVHYGMVQSLRDDLCAHLPKDLTPEETKAAMRQRMKLFFSHCQIMAEEMHNVLQGQSVMDWYKKNRLESSKQLHSWFCQMKEKLLNLTAHKRDGDMFLGTGRIVGVNHSMLAHTISAFPGSSGAAIFLLDGIFGCFVGVHNAPASISKDECWSMIPDHNVACNVENSAFGKMYFKDVLGNLNPKSVGERACVLYRFIGYHLPTILATYPLKEWTNMQREWIKNALSYLVNPPSKVNRDLQADFDERKGSQETGDEEYKKWRLLWKRALTNADPACIKALDAEMFMDDI